MKGYNFGGISTDKLRKLFNSNSKGCNGINCIFDGCPLGSDCNNMRYDEVYTVLMNELKRREDKEMNKMPELKAGMIVEFNDNELRILLPCKIHTCGLGLYLNDGSGYLDPRSVGINKLWSNGEFTYYEFFKNGKVSAYHDLIWSKKSDTQIKIDELSETINKANAQIEELRKGLK